MRVLIATDAWRPQINGVVRSLERMVEAAPEFGVTPHMLTPEGFRQVGLPSYPDIRIALASRRHIAGRIAAFGPDHVHIATEGPIGWLTRAVCLAQKRTFTTSYHTRFPQYVAARWPIPESWSYRFLRRFHGPAAGVMVSTATVEAELRAHGFERILRWGRGVDLSLFHPRPGSVLDLPRPIFLSVGRVAVEKISRPSCRCACPAARSSSATARRAPTCSAPSRRRISSGRARAKTSLRSMLPPTSSCSRA